MLRLRIQQCSDVFRVNPLGTGGRSRIKPFEASQFEVGPFEASRCRAPKSFGTSLLRSSSLDSVRAPPRRYWQVLDRQRRQQQHSEAAALNPGPPTAAVPTFQGELLEHVAKGPASGTTLIESVLPEAEVTRRYKALLVERDLEPNVAQSQLAAKLGCLQTAILDAQCRGSFAERLRVSVQELDDQTRILECGSPAMTTISSLFARLGFSNLSLAGDARPAQPTTDEIQLSQLPYPEVPKLKSLYIWGGVGQGKTMLMDAFFNSTDIQQKRRVHFHPFMLEIQQRLHALHASGGKAKAEARAEPPPRGRSAPASPSQWDPLLTVAYEMAKNCHLLCLDEFQVVHIADAMILRRLFESLTHLLCCLQFGCVVVATSNRAPSELYKGGLNRDRFVPFIEFVEARWDVFHIQAAKDFRQQKVIVPSSQPLGQMCAQLGAFHCPVRGFDRVLSHMCAVAEGEGPPQPLELQVLMGRALKVPYHIGDTCLFRFDDLCRAPVGTGDFIALAERFRSVFLYDIPPLAQFDDTPNEIRRFIQLVDVLYERLVRVVFDSRVPLLQLFGPSVATQAIAVLRGAVRRLFPDSLQVFLDLVDKEIKKQGHRPAEIVASIANLPFEVAYNAVYVADRAQDLHHAMLTRGVEVDMPKQAKAETFTKYLRSCVIFHADNFDHDVDEYFTRERTRDALPNLSFDFGSGPASAVGASANSAGANDNRFAFERTLSRIRDMLSQDYLVRHDRQWCASQSV